jgi:arylsulfatase
MGGITEMTTPAPGYNSMRPNTCATIAEILKLNGYATAHVGKCHEVPVWETNPAGPFDRWPTPGNGFEYFYGFLGGETDQYYPTLREGITRVEPWGTPEEGYHLTEDLTDKAIAWIRQQKALTPGQAVLRLLRAGCHPRPPPRAQGVGCETATGCQMAGERARASNRNAAETQAGHTGPGPRRWRWRCRR